MIETLTGKFFRSFILKLLLFVTTVMLMDLIIGYVLRKNYFSQKAGPDYLTIYSMEKSEADMFIFGSSRATNILNPDIFKEQLNLSCYNAGRPGEPIFYHYAVLKSVLKRTKPKIIVLSFDAGLFNINPESYDRLSVLLPFYTSHPEIRSILSLKRPHEKVKMLSHIYPYNSHLISIISGNSKYAKMRYAYSNGFSALKKTYTGPIKTMDYSDKKVLDSIKINVCKAFIQECYNSGVELYIVCPPYLLNSTGTDLSLIEGKRIAHEYNINFLDYSRDTFFTKRIELYADFRHLNEKGANLFSHMVAEKIKQLRNGNEKVVNEKKHLHIDNLTVFDFKIKSSAK